MEEHLADQAVIIANDPSLRAECRPGRKQSFLITYFFEEKFDSGLSIKIDCCCLGEAHGRAYFQLWEEAKGYVDQHKTVKAVCIRTGPVISEGKKI